MDVEQKETVAKSVLDKDIEDIEEIPATETPVDVVHKANADNLNRGFLDDDESSSGEEEENSSSISEDEAVITKSQMKGAAEKYVDVADNVFYCSEDSCTFASGAAYPNNYRNVLRHKINSLVFSDVLTITFLPMSLSLDS